MLLKAAGLDSDALPIRLVLPPTVNPNLASEDAGVTTPDAPADVAGQRARLQSQQQQALPGASSTVSNAPVWSAVSCAVSSNGEILCINHTISGVTAEQPNILAVAGSGCQVQMRLLEREEAHNRYGAKANQLIGCAITGLATPVQSKRLHFARNGVLDKVRSGSTDLATAEQEFVLFTRSQEDMNQLRAALSPWLSTKVEEKPVLS